MSSDSNSTLQVRESAESDRRVTRRHLSLEVGNSVVWCDGSNVEEKQFGSERLAGEKDELDEVDTAEQDAAERALHAV